MPLGAVAEDGHLAAGDRPPVDVRFVEELRHPLPRSFSSRRQRSHRRSQAGRPSRRRAQCRKADPPGALDLEDPVALEPGLELVERPGVADEHDHRRVGALLDDLGAEAPDQLHEAGLAGSGHADGHEQELGLPGVAGVAAR